MSQEWENYEFQPNATTTLPPCRHCGQPSNVCVYLPQGCFVFPDDRQQWLCWQHYDRLDNIHTVTKVVPG